MLLFNLLHRVSKTLTLKHAAFVSKVDFESPKLPYSTVVSNLTDRGNYKIPLPHFTVTVLVERILIENNVLT